MHADILIYGVRPTQAGQLTLAFKRGVATLDGGSTNARFWAYYFRRVYVRAIQGFRAGALEKAAPAFSGIAEEADAANLANVSRRKERPEPGTA